MPPKKNKKNKYLHGEAVIFDPKWTPKKDFPLSPKEIVYFLGNIPNVPGHCIVAKWCGAVIPMIHPEDLRKAKDEEL